MATRNVPDSQHAKSTEWSDKEVLQFARYSQQALSHSMGRNARIVKILCYLSLLRSTDKLAADANIEVVAAQWQNYSSNAGNQAAHYLPGQLMVDGQELSTLARNLRTASEIRCLFGDVEDLPADFNKADTQAEAKATPQGLCAAFEEAARQVIADSSPANTINRSAVRSAYTRVWVPKARLAFIHAQRKKAGKYKKPDIEYGAAGGAEYNTIQNLSERENITAYQARVDHQQDILRHYLTSLAKSPTELNDENMSKLERRFKA